MKEEHKHKCVNKDELLEKTKLNIEKFGLQVISVTATGYSQPFSYSIGIWDTYGHSEIICFGLPADLAHAIINDVAKLIRQGEKFKQIKRHCYVLYVLNEFCAYGKFFVRAVIQKKLLLLHL